MTVFLDDAESVRVASALLESTTSAMSAAQAAHAELADLRASNARMADVLSSVRDRLGLDDGGSVLDALDKLLPHKSEETFVGRVISLLPGSIVEVDDATRTYANMIGAPAAIVVPDSQKPARREGEPA